MMAIDAGPRGVKFNTDCAIATPLNRHTTASVRTARKAELRSITHIPAEGYGFYARAKLQCSFFEVPYSGTQRDNLLSMTERIVSAFDGTSIGRLANAGKVPDNSCRWNRSLKSTNFTP